MAQQRGMKRAQKVLARKQKKAVLATKTSVRKVVRQAEVAKKEEVAAAKKK
jgi:hypothetical protein